MKFGAVAPKQALGGTAVHSIRQGELVLKKGTLIGPAEVAALEAAGIKDIVVAQLEPGDVSEDVAAADIAKKIAGPGVHIDRAFTGRANLFAETAGVLVVDKDAVDRLNRVDEAITFATLPAFKAVVAGEMIATVKIIPFAAQREGARRRAGRHRQAAASRRAVQDPQGRRGLHAAARPRPQSDREDAEDHCRPAGARWRHDRCRTPRAARARGVGARARRGAQGWRRARHRIWRIRDCRPPRCDPGGARSDRRPCRAFRHAGRSRQSPDDRRRGRPSGARRARLRAQPQGKRLRLGVDAASRRTAGAARRHYRHSASAAS